MSLFIWKRKSIGVMFSRLCYKIVLGCGGNARDFMCCFRAGVAPDSRNSWLKFHGSGKWYDKSLSFLFILQNDYNFDKLFSKFFGSNISNKYSYKGKMQNIPSLSLLIKSGCYTIYTSILQKNLYNLIKSLF